MRQVPRYLLIGDGRLARHLRYYFSLLQFNFSCWNRKESIAQLHQKANHASHILLLISDNAIEDFIHRYLANTPAILIHCSGSLVSTKAYGAHPLMSFNNDKYELSQYQAIPFIVDEDAPNFSDLLPLLPNACFKLSKKLKAKYHALCVMSGNFSCLLWSKFFESLEQDFHLPRSVAHAYLQQCTQNLLLDYKSAFTGPLARNDEKTIDNNLTALEQDPFQAVYQSFVSCYQKITAQELI